MHRPAGGGSPEQPDDVLAWRCLGGDPTAFQALTVRYYRPVSAFIFKRVNKCDLVEDLAQETFLQAYRALRGGTRPEHLSSWLFGIAHNVCGKWLRRKKPALFAADDPPEQAVVSAELSAREELEEQQQKLAALDAGLACLPEETRRLLELKHKVGRTCEQIAAELGRPVGTIKSLLSRAYKTLRDLLGPAGDEGA